MTFCKVASKNQFHIFLQSGITSNSDNNMMRQVMHNSESNINRQYLEDMVPTQSQQFYPQPEYKLTNAYTHSPAWQQIMTICLFLGIAAIHSTFITTAAVQMNSPIMWTLIAVTYGFTAIIFYDYCYLTCSDPVDDLILKVPRNYRQSQINLCTICRSNVHKKSYHCRICNRCSEYFDHHCKYLNQCIGGKNYLNFLRMLLFVTAYCLFIIGEGIWVLIKTANDESFQNELVSKWGVLGTVILAGIAVVAVDSLLCFHFYLIFILKGTTLSYINDLPDSTQSGQVRN